MNPKPSCPTRKSWREKLADDKDLPKVVKLPAAAQKRWGGKTMVIAAPREVDALIRTIRKGRVATINNLRAALAKKHKTETACPITTGIFSWIAANAAAEDEAAGKKRITPWWRVLKEGSKLNPKFPGGLVEHARRLRAEGHTVVKGRVLLCTAETFSRLPAHSKTKPTHETFRAPPRFACICPGYDCHHFCLSSGTSRTPRTSAPAIRRAI